LPGEWQIAKIPSERKEIQRIIDWCKDHLKEVQKMVFTLRHLEDLESDEICKVLNISTSNYWVLIYRARLQMRDCVEKKWLKG
jgi:DNA-directed RNA polymerase specialized sigma24 family protein